MNKTLKDIEAKHVSGTEDDFRGNEGKVECPVCRKAINQRDLETHWPTDEKVTVELCCDCRADFEAETGKTIDADVIDDDLFSSLYKWAIENAGPTSNAETSSEDRMRAVATALNGELWQSGGGIWLVICRRKDGKVVVVSDEVICEYASEEAFENSKPSKSIGLV